MPYPTGIVLVFVTPWLGLVPFVIVAVIWLVPDRRVERYLRTRADRVEPSADGDDEGPTP
ncbi:MAG: hypothetical protein JST33_03215 [Actinobacteria bacterium]|nr:hypothetical protein [Actinomycetota bacterium]